MDKRMCLELLGRMDVLGSPTSVLGCVGAELTDFVRSSNAKSQLQAMETIIKELSKLKEICDKTEEETNVWLGYNSVICKLYVHDEKMTSKVSKAALKSYIIGIFTSGKNIKLVSEFKESMAMTKPERKFKHLAFLKMVVKQMYRLFPATTMVEFDKEVTDLWFKMERKTDKILHRVSTMFDECEMMKKFVGKNFADFISLLAKMMNHCCGSEGDYGDVSCQLITKICLQVVQTFLNDIKPVIWDDSEHELQSDIIQIIKCLLSVIFTQRFSPECGLLAGSAVGLLMNAAADKNGVLKTAINLLQMNTGGSLTKRLQFGHLVIDLSLGDNGQNNVFPTLVLLKAMLTCMDKELLISLVQQDGKQGPFMYCILFQEVCSLCRNIAEDQYHAFQVLALWLQSAKNSLHLLYTNKHCEERIFSKDSSYVKEVLQLIWENWENPIDGVADSIKTSFSSLLDIYNEESKLCGINDQMFFEELSTKLVNTSWHVKGKYGPLCSLVPYIGASKLLTDHPEIAENLVSCLATNYLAPPSCEVYKMFLQTLRKECPKSDEDKMAEFWSQYWRSHLIHALCHNTQLLRHNASHYWLPWTLKVFPSAFHLLTEVLRCNPSEASSARCLHSQISVLNAARNLNLIHGSDLTSEPICEALWHSDDDIRSDTVGLLCTSHRKSESMSELELTLLKNFFPLNMNCDSSSFRQHLYAYTKRLIVRIRDSCIAMVKQYKKTSMTDVDPPRQLQMSVEFVDWLYSLCISSLFPGSSYQRRKTSLELIIAVLEGFITENTTCQRKGQTPGAVEVLISWATEHNKWSFFSNRNASVLLHCLEDGTNEIRELSYSVLTNYFPWPLMCCENSVDSAECQILQHCYHLLCSPKAMQCESGALMCKMVCKQYTTGLGWDFNMVTTTPGNVTITKDTETTNKYCKLHFIKQLVQLLADQYHCAKRNLLKAASTSPMHGIVLALRRCLTEDTDIAAMTTGVEATEWRSLIGQILSMVETIINSMLQVLFGKNANPDTDTSPDFAEMGLAIDEVIAESLGEDSEYEESAVISTEHQLILACCWLNIKECSQLLGSFANKFSFSLESSNGLLTTEQVRTMADIFVKILTKCRHRGAIEGCSLGFIKLCSRLLSSSIQELSSIPKNILVQTFSLLESPKSGTSITRRSAGLPLIIEAITSCEPKGREKLLLKQCMERLLIAVHQPLPESAAQTMDLPQVHAFNILRSLFRSSVLGNAMLKYACDVVMVTIKGFSSPSWAVRNGCTLLYGTLVARMLGQKRVQDEHSQLNSITAQEFFVRYPKLYPFLLSQLEEASQYQKDNKLCLYPALHPVLTLLSKLGPGIQQDNTQCSLTKFIEPVMKLSSSPIYTVRVLAAAALVPLVAMKDKVETLAAILDNIPDSASMVKSHNKLHGMLLQTEKLLFSVLANIRRHEDTVNISKHLLKKIWLASEKNLCCLTKALYLDILIKFCTQVRCNDDAVHLLSTLNEIIKKSVSEVEVTPVRSIQIGDAMLSRAKVTASLKMASDENKQKEFLTEFLVCDNREIRYSSLQYVAESLRSETNTVRFLKEFLLKYITEHLTAEQDMACLHTKLELFIELSEELDLSVCEENLFSLCDVLLPLANGDRGTTLTAVAIPALACIVKQHIHHRKYRNLICELCCLVDKYSKSTNVEDLRLSVTKTLQIVGCQIITMIAQSLDEDLLPFAFRIFTSSVQLLQDEIQEVRMAAAEFTVLLPRPPCFVRYSSLHSNAGLQLLMMYFFMVFDWSDSFLDFILGYLQGNITPVQAIKDQHLTSSVHLFEQEDANIYAEHLITVQMMYTNLHKLVDKGIKERYFRDTVKSTLQSTITILKATHDEIQTSPKQGYGIHGVLGYTKPFLAVHRLILYSNLLLSVARQKVARQKGDLDEEITTLSQELQLCISMLCQIGSTAHNMKCTGESFAKFPTINE